ncbi:MAG: hypothetical protein C4326_01905 [Ignavibacteria bacterium]
MEHEFESRWGHSILLLSRKRKIDLPLRRATGSIISRLRSIKDSSPIGGSSTREDDSESKRVNAS